MVANSSQLGGGPIRLIDSPIRYMRARAAFGPPRLFSAFLPVVINALALGGTGILSQSRMSVLAPDFAEPVSIPGLPISVGILVAIIGGLAIFAVHAGAVIMLDMAVVQSRQARRFVELCALSYWPQLLVSIPVLAATWWFFDPPPLVYRGAGADVMAAAMNYADEVARLPFAIIVDTARQFATLWLIALHVCTLRVVSGLTGGGTWAAGIILAILFIGVPWLVGRFAERLFF